MVTPYHGPYLLPAIREEAGKGPGGEELSHEDSTKHFPPPTIRNEDEGRCIISCASHSLSDVAAREGDVLVLEDLLCNVGGGDDDGQLLA